MYPGDHTQGGSLTMQQYKSMYDDFGSEDKAVKHLIEVTTHMVRCCRQLRLVTASVTRRSCHKADLSTASLHIPAGNTTRLRTCRWCRMLVRLLCRTM